MENLTQDASTVKKDQARAKVHGTKFAKWKPAKRLSGHTGVPFTEVCDPYVIAGKYPVKEPLLIPDTDEEESIQISSLIIGESVIDDEINAE